MYQQVSLTKLHVVCSYHVKVVGGLLSMGDCHGSQSEGETAATGIESSLNGKFRYTDHACLQPACNMIALLVDYDSCDASVCLATRLSVQSTQTSL